MVERPQYLEVDDVPEYTLGYPREPITYFARHRTFTRLAVIDFFGLDYQQDTS